MLEHRNNEYPGISGGPVEWSRTHPKQFFFHRLLWFWDQCGRKSEEEPVPGLLPNWSLVPPWSQNSTRCGGHRLQIHTKLIPIEYRTRDWSPTGPTETLPGVSSDGTPFKMGWWDQFGMAKQLLGQHTMCTGRRGPI